MRQSQNHLGFTVIEMMIAIAVVAVIAALALPAFTEFFEKSRLRGAADDVVSFFNAQRLASVKFDRQVSASVRGSGTSWCLGARMAPTPAAGQQVAAAGTCDCSSDASTCLVDGQAATYDVSTIGASAVRPSIDSADIAVTYDGRRGTLTNFADAGNVVISSSSARWKLRVDVMPLGQARTCVPSDSLPVSGFNRC